MQSSVSIDLATPGALTQESVARLISSASDRTNTQLRVTKEGVAFISSADVGAPEWVDRIYTALKDNWPRPSSSHIDLF